MNVLRESSASPPPINRVQQAPSGSASSSGPRIAHQESGQAIDPASGALGRPQVHLPSGASALRAVRGLIRRLIRRLIPRHSQSIGGETSEAVQHQTPSSQPAGGGITADLGFDKVEEPAPVA